MKKIFLSVLIVLGLAGCAVSSHYVNYTEKKFLPKPRNYVVKIYTASKRMPNLGSYYVIGSIELSGYASAGVTPDALRKRAKVIVRKKGADAIINASIKHFSDREVYVRHGYYGRYYYHPREYIVSNDKLFVFHGDLIVFSAGVVK